MFRQLSTVLSAQHALLSTLDRQLPSDAQQACEVAEQGITLHELQAALKLSARDSKPGSDGLPSAFLPQIWEVLDSELPAVRHGLCLPISMTQKVITLLTRARAPKACLTSTARLPYSTTTTSYLPRLWLPALGLPTSILFYFLGGRALHYTYMQRKANVL